MIIYLQQLNNFGSWGESVCPAIKEEAGYSKEEFDKVNKENEDPELKSIKSFNDTVKKANEIV